MSTTLTLKAERRAQVGVAQDEGALASATAGFEAAYRAHFAHVWRTVRRLGVPDRELEDITHDVFLVAHRRWPDYDSDRPIRPWLTGIAYRVAADTRRLARRQREVFKEDPLRGVVDPAPGPEADAARAQSRALVVAALQRLDLDRRVVFVMADIDGTPGPQIAEALQIPLNTVYSRLRVARGRFAEAVKALRGEGAP